MKSQIRQLALLFLSMLFMFTSCQNESVEETDPETAGEVITQNSEVAKLVLNTTAKDGSFDNILDRNHCTEIKLPVTVVIRDIEITIDSEEDLETIERIFDEFEDDLDELDFLFPITVILADHTEVVIENQERLEALIEECEEDDDDIECIDFEYPITISVFDDNNEQIGTETFENDKQLYRFFKNLKENEFVSFNFPMVLVDSEGERVTINDNDELAEAIRVAKNECDEDDDDDYNDDDFSVERLKNYLVECPFGVQHFVRDNNDLTDDYYRYVVDFKEDGTLIASRMPDGVPVDGEWEVEEGENGRPVLLISIGQLTDFNNEWLVYEIDDDKIKLFTEGSRIILHQRCDDDNEPNCNIDRVAEKLETCKWRISEFDGSTDLRELIVDFSNRNIHAFNANGEAIDEGNWNVGERAIDFNDLSMNLQILNGSWMPVECEGEKLVFKNANEQELILEKDCNEGGEGFSEEELDAIIKECNWEVAAFNFNGDDVTAQYMGYNFTFNMDQTVTATTPGSTEAINGSWSTQSGNPGEVFFLWDMAEPLQELMNDWKLYELSEERVKFIAGDSYVVLERSCEGDNTDGDVEAILSYMQQGEWKVADYDDSSVPGTDETNYDIYIFTFTTDGKMIATNPNMVETEGSYDVFRNDSGKLQFTILDFVQPDLLEMLDGEFDVVKAEENRIELFVEYSQSTKKIVFEKM